MFSDFHSEYNLKKRKPLLKQLTTSQTKKICQPAVGAAEFQLSRWGVEQAWK